ncbi:MAG: endo-1,4-beta-xylanase [Anaerolineales bacterium]|nr:endo-1,4-beta-xylanase [Anaerolineales bacterium]
MLVGCGAPQVLPTATALPPTSTSTSTPLPTATPTDTPTPTAVPPTPTIIPTSEVSLRELASQRGLLFGAGVSAQQLAEDNYGALVAREFNQITADNAMKFKSLHPLQKVYDFKVADKLIAFAQQNNMVVRGHTLVWHSQLSSWVENGNFTRDEMIAILKDHVTTVVSHYRGQVEYWDVVNEAVADEDGSLRDTVWLRTIGPEYIDMAFQFAHEADPKAKLFYNDYNNEDMGMKSNAVYDLVKGMVERGVPIDGVGLQMHLILESPPQTADVIENMKRLDDLGLEVNITELDVRMKVPASDADLSAQATVYGDMMQACLSVPNCKVFTIWGFSDRHSWIPGFFDGYGSALIFDDAMNPKPAYLALLNALMQK